MPKKLLENASFSSISQVVNIAVSLLFVPAYIYYLGIDGYGIYAFLMLTFSWITVLQAGIDPAVIRLTSKYVAEGRLEDLRPLITASLALQTLIASLVGLALFGSADFLAQFIVKDEVNLLKETRAALYYSAFNVLFLMCKNVYISLFKGLQRYDISSIYESSFQLLASIVALLLLWLGHGIVGMILARLILNLMSIALLHILAKKLLASFRYSLNISKDLIVEIYTFASWVVVGRLNRLAVNALPPIFIGMYVGPSGIAYFNIASRIVVALNNLLASSVAVVFPFVSELKALNEDGKIKSLYLGANRFLSVVSAPLYCFGAIFSWDVLNAWLGQEIADNCWQLMSGFFVGYYISSSTMVPGNFALGVGNSRILAFAGFSQTIVVILFLPYLLRTLGIVGAAVNLVLFEAVGVVTGIIITVFMIKASVVIFWLKDRLSVLIACATIFCALSPIKAFICQQSCGRLESVTYLSVVLVTGLVFYGLFVYKIGLIDPAIKYRLANVLRKA